jgi:type IV pilus assembly protein PilV
MMTLANPKQQSGVLLIEALVGILIFSVGIIALIGLQGAAIANSTEAKYRSDGAYFAQKIVALIWADRGTSVDPGPPKYDTSGTGNAKLTAWRNEVSATLPGASGANLPTVTVSGNWINGYDVTVVVRWQKPGADARNYTATTRVVSN